MRDPRINNPEQICSARVLFTEWGEKIIVAENGCLSFTVSADRGMDVYSLRHRGTNISFLSKNGFRASRQSFDTSFEGGFLYTCGLDTVGGREIPVHGRLHNTPAQILEVTADGHKILLRGVVRFSRLFGENLALYRTIKCDAGSGVLTIENELVNEGYCAAEYCLLFHTNFGYPFLDEGLKIVADVKNTKPRTPFAAEGLNSCFVIGAPKAGEEERVYFHETLSGKVSLINKKISKRVDVEYDCGAMPYFIEWKSMAGGDYALGIEPSTTTLDGDFKRNILKAGERKSFPLTINTEDINI